VLNLRFKQYIKEQKDSNIRHMEKLETKRNNEMKVQIEEAKDMLGIIDQ